MKKTLLTIIVSFGLSMVSVAQESVGGQEQMVELTATELNSLYQTTSRNWKSVHDPSVVWDEATETFYIYGSHYYGVKTKDFWDGAITSEKPPLRLKIRNICGDETEWAIL